MKAFFTVRRINGILWAKMYTNQSHAACRPVANRKEAKIAFIDFIKELLK